MKNQPKKLSVTSYIMSNDKINPFGTLSVRKNGCFRGQGSVIQVLEPTATVLKLLALTGLASLGAVVGAVLN